MSYSPGIMNNAHQQVSQGWLFQPGFGSIDNILKMQKSDLKDYVNSLSCKKSKNDIATFLKNLFFYFEYSPTASRQKLIEILTYLSLPFDIEALIFNYPEEFIHLVGMVIKEDANKGFLLYYTLLTSQLEVNTKKQICQKILNVFRREDCRELVEILYQRFDVMTICLFLANTEDTHFLDEFVQSWLSYQKPISEAIINLLIAFSKLQEGTKIDDDTPLLKVLFVELATNPHAFSDVLVQLDKVSDVVKGYILSNIPLKQLHEWVDSNRKIPEVLVQRLQCAMRVQKSIPHRIAFMREFFSTLPIEQLSSVIKAMKSHYPNGMIYLPIALSESLFLSWVIQDDGETHTETLKALPLYPDEAFAVFSEMGKNPVLINCLLTEYTFCIDGKSIEENNQIFTFKSLIDQFVFESDSDHHQIWERYLNAIHQIPSFLIGIAALAPRYHHWLREAVCYLNDDQRQALACSLPKAIIVSFMDSINAFKEIVNGFSKEQLSVYLQGKLAQLINSKADYTKRCEELLKKLASLKNVDKGQYEQLVSEQRQLKLIHKISSGPQYTFLHQISLALTTMPTDPQSLFSQYSSIRLFFVKFSGVYFKGENGIDMQLAKLKSTLSMQIEEEEPISEAYWKRIPNLEHDALGIEHAGKILEVGIKSDRDFELLGFSLKHQASFDQLQYDILKLVNDEDESNYKKAKNLLNELLKMDVLIKEEAFQNLIALMPTLDESNKINPIYIKMLKQIDGMAMTKEEADLYQTIQQELSTNAHIRKGKVIEFMLKFIKAHDSLLVLQKYLKQPSLVKIWQKLHLKGERSLGQLMQMGVDPRKFFELEKYIGELF